MSLLVLLLGIGLVVIVAALVIFVVRESTLLKTTASALQLELKQFKEGGFDRLISEKLVLLTQRSVQELEERERLIRAQNAQILEEERKTTQAVSQFSTDLGTITAQIANLQQLQHQIGELNDLLKPQQLRGELGEVIVRMLIADKLPKGQYEEDYTFADGKKVEFAIRLNDRLIPVDAKLQLEDFKRMREAEERQRPAYRAEWKRTVKQKIDEVKQYIRPEEGTYNFAFMVVPSEAVYYELIGSKDFLEDGGLYEYAQRQNVFLVSPLTFWAYLTAVAHGLQGLEIGRRAEEILTELQALATKLRNFSQDEFRILGGHLRNAATQYEQAERKLRDIEDGFTSLERRDTEAVSQSQFLT